MSAPEPTRLNRTALAPPPWPTPAPATRLTTLAAGTTIPVPPSWLIVPVAPLVISKVPIFVIAAVFKVPSRILPVCTGDPICTTFAIIEERLLSKMATSAVGPPTPIVAPAAASILIVPVPPALTPALVVSDDMLFRLMVCPLPVTLALIVIAPVVSNVMGPELAVIPPLVPI